MAQRRLGDHGEEGKLVLARVEGTTGRRPGRQPPRAALEEGLTLYAEAGKRRGLEIRVRYAAEKFIDAKSLDDRDVIVRGPDGSRFDVELLRWDKIYSGRQRRVTYRLSPPGGAWDDADEGTYTVVLRSKQVRDNFGNFAAKGVIGTFQLTVF